MRFTTLPLALSLAAAASIANAGPQCSNAPEAEWIPQETFKTGLIEQGYNLKKFKVTSGNCYEIYGWNKEGKKVEIYFNPTDGSIVKQEIDD